MTAGNLSTMASIGKRALRLILLAAVLVLSGIGVLSLTINWRDAANLYFAHASSYKRYIGELEKDSRNKNQAHIDRLAENFRLKAANDSLMLEMKGIEKRIAENKMAFRREVMMDIFGFKRELSVTRDWDRGTTLQWKGTEIARAVLHNFWDIPLDTNLPAAYMTFYRSGKPWYVREMLNRVYTHSQAGSAEGADCWLQPVSIDTTVNKYGVLIATLRRTRECGSGNRRQPESEEYWIGTAADSSRWIIEIQPNADNIRKLGLGPAFLARVLDSLMFRQYHYH